MNEIKFRAWDVKDKEFLDVGKLYQEDEIYVVEEHPDCGDRVLFVGESGGERENEVELMQYTGLKDKNGVEIYEGDIIWDAHAEIHGKVIFDEGTFCVEWETHIENLFEVVSDYYAEVIGNIYQHPELLGDSQ